MRKRAAILLQRAVPADRQTDICAPYCLEHRYSITIIPYWAPEQAVQLVRDQLIDVVIVAFEGRTLPELVEQVADAGGKVIAVHPQPRELRPRRGFGRVSEMIARWHRKGRTVPEIAELLDSDTTDIRSALAELGVHRDRK